MTRLVVRPQAEADVDEALAWYHERDPRLAERLFIELDQVFHRIEENPAPFPIVAEPVRRALLYKFLYSVYFFVAGELAAVVAVVHQKRKPTGRGLAARRL